MNEEDKLKKELIDLLATTNEEKGSGIKIRDKIDYSKLLRLSDLISKHDNENVRFSVDAKIVDRLGKQLVAKKTTALSELIKNAYDADARKAIVAFDGTEKPGGRITISDDGNGMSFQELVSGFMTISTSDKAKNPASPEFKRPRAGKKGIGRFSAQKIGKQLKLITKRKADNRYLCINIDWDKFESDSYLGSVESKIYYDSDSYDFESGTILEISDVREAWTESNIKTTYKYLASILTIAPANDSDPGFKAEFSYKDEHHEVQSLKKFDEQTEFLNKADLKVSAYMDPKGYLVIDIKGLHDSRFTETLTLEEGYNENLLKVDFSVELLYYSREKTAKIPRALREYLNTNGGIKFFRNGFNVVPYGSRNNDWLGLDDSYQRRTFLPPHSNTNYIGKVSVVDLSGELFEETSAREGVIENDAFDELVSATYDVAIKVASHVAEIRGKKVTASQKDYKGKRVSKEEELKNQIELMREALKKQSAQDVSKDESFKLDGDGSSQGSEAEQDRLEDDADLESHLDKVSSTLKEYIDEQLMYRVLSSTGLAISEFTHEIQTCLTNLTFNSQSLEQLAAENSVLEEIANQLEENLDMLIAYTDFFDGTMRSNSNREKHFYNMRSLVKRFLNAMNATIERRGYEVSTHFDSWSLWTKKIHISEIMSVFINLFTNSSKAIERAGRADGKLSIEVLTEGEFMVIKFQDNGDGIPKAKWGDVFTPLYTTAMPSASKSKESDYTRGMGLGLSITETIIEEMNGEISVNEPDQDFSTCIRIILPLANEEELPEDAY